MCGSVRHRDAETTRNKPRTDKSHLQIVGQNRMIGSVRDANFLLQFHDGHSSMILNQLSHFFNQRNSGNVLTALRILILIAFLRHQGSHEFALFLPYTYICCLVLHSYTWKTMRQKFKIH